MACRVVGCSVADGSRLKWNLKFLVETIIPIIRRTAGGCRPVLGCATVITLAARPVGGTAFIG